jgi:hypothetical protein
MTTQEHLLTCLAEECAEIQHRVCKALRFGIDDIDPTTAAPDAKTERSLIKEEVTDLIAVAQLLVEEGILPDGFDPAWTEKKKAKVRRFMEYAKTRGALQ